MEYKFKKALVITLIKNVFKVKFSYHFYYKIPYTLIHNIHCILYTDKSTKSFIFSLTDNIADENPRKTHK